MENVKTNIQVRPAMGQNFPQSMRVDCARGLSENHPVGTKFRITVQVKDDGNGLGEYLKVPGSLPYEVVQ